MREKREMRSRTENFAIREENDDLVIEGYFAVFNSPYYVAEGYTEFVDYGAFAKSLDENADVRALINHDTTLVVGRTKAGTLELKQDEKGLWGKVILNVDDTSAMDIYARVKRGDVDQCSFGFEITDEEVKYNENGAVEFHIKSVNLYEVSICTFPAYEGTSVSARSNDIEMIERNRLDCWKATAKEKLMKGKENNGN